jgi:hypothetical protein
MHTAGQTTGYPLWMLDVSAQGTWAVHTASSVARLISVKLTAKAQQARVRYTDEVRLGIAMMVCHQSNGPDLAPP